MGKAIPVFMDSFQYEYANILGKWTAMVSTPGALSIGAFGRVRGERAIMTTSSGGDNRGYYRTLPGSYQTVVFGGWAYHSVVPNAGNTFLYAGQGSTVGIGLRGDAAGHITAYRATTLITNATSTLTVSTGWHFYEVKSFINGSTGTIDVNVDGTSYISLTGANTGSSAVNSLGMNFQATTTAMFTGVYACDATGAGTADMLGPQICYPRFPVEAGTTTDWTGNFGPNYANVNDQVPDGDATFNHSSTTGHIDLFKGSDLPGTGGISGIQHVIWARTDGSSHTIRPAQRIGTTTYHAMTAQAVGGSYSALLFPTAVSPVDGSSLFTASVLNDSENGYELVS